MVVFRYILLLCILVTGCIPQTKQLGQTSDNEGYNFFIPPKITLVNLDKVEPELMDTLCTYLSDKFVLCSSTENHRLFPKNLGKELDVDTALGFLRSIKPSDAKFTIGITTRKIFVTENGKRKTKQLLGHAKLGGQVSIVSTYELSRKKHFQENFKNRVIKVMVHELGHNLGLEHCISTDQCIMHEQAGSPQQLDRMEMIFCRDCHFKLISEIQFAFFY